MIFIKKMNKDICYNSWFLWNVYSAVHLYFFEWFTFIY